MRKKFLRFRCRCFGDDLVIAEDKLEGFYEDKDRCAVIFNFGGGDVDVYEDYYFYGEEYHYTK